MNTTKLIKTLACAMLMPAVLLTASCSKGDDAVTNPEKPATTEAAETAVNKGYALPVTVNVTRQDDEATTRATYNETTKKLEFSAGDKLFVSGSATAAGSFAGMLDYVSEGTFSGTIYTQNEYSGTADALFTAANSDRVEALLFPNGYESYGFLSLWGSGYSTSYITSLNNAIAATKAAAVEQISLETAETYSSGFALSPENAILNFTITGLTDGAKDVRLMHGGTPMFVGSVTPTSGTATFALGAGIEDSFFSPVNLKNVILTIGDTDIDITDADKYLTAGKIYNITRGTGATVDLSTKNADYTAQNGETLTGTLASNVKISIADGATVILNGVTINGTNSDDYQWAGISCEGDATIILSGTNTVKGFHIHYPGIHIAEGKTLTIKGTGSLNASSNGQGSGIGGGYAISNGNIVIEGGTITATGGQYAPGIGGTGGNITISGGTITARGGGTAAGIGSGNDGDCRDITISGGTVTAYGGKASAGIGGGFNGSTCGNITITSGVTRVTATKGSDTSPCSIGKGKDSNKPSTCGTVTIDGTVYAGGITDSPYTYQP